MADIMTQRLRLRSFEKRDVPALHAIYSNPETMRYWSKPPFEQTSQTEAFVEAVMAAEPSTTIEFVIELEGDVIGRAGFWQGSEIGYLFHPAYWGQGFGTEAIAALLAFGFDTRGLAEATADVDPENAGSIALLKRLGFSETGRAKNTIEIAGVWYDSVYFALSAKEWRAKA